MSSSSQPVPLTPAQVNYAQPEQWRQAIRQELADARVAIPAFMTKDMDAATQTVTVQIAIQDRVRTPTGPQWWDYPPIQYVPPMIYRGGGFSITLPLKKGTEGLLIFCDCCFDFWWKNGTNNAPVADNSTGTSEGPSGSQRQIGMHRHEFWDCGFYPGLSSQPNILGNYSSSSMQIRSDDGDTIIDISESSVNVTADNVTINAGDEVQITSPEINANQSGGTPLALVNDNGWQWIVNDLYPWMQSKGYTGIAPPSNGETTIFKAQ